MKEADGNLFGFFYFFRRLSFVLIFAIRHLSKFSFTWFKKLNVLLIITTIIILISGCYPTRNISGNHQLLLSNNYKIINGKVKKHFISSYFAQKPNRKIFFYRLYLNVYDFGTMFRDSSWINRQLTQNIGEPPVIYDSAMVDFSGRNIKKHLDNLGYYNNSVSVKVKKWNALKVAKVTYLVDVGKPYTIRKINYMIPENDLRYFVQADLGNSLLKSEINFSVETLEKERDRIVAALNNAGYYYFMRNQITYLADTNLNSHQVDITMKILPLESKAYTEDSAVFLVDKRFYVKDIYIIYDLMQSDLGKPYTDTLVASAEERNKKVYKYHFIYSKNMDVNPKAIINGLFIKPRLFYKKRDVVESYKALAALNNFRYINIELEDVSKPDEIRGQLICNVSLLSFKKFSFTSNSEVKNTGGDFGLEQNVGLKILNTFKNAEVLNTSIHGAMEMQSSNYDNSTSKWPFNVYEAGLNSSIDFPRFISPFQIFKGNRYLRPHTRVALGYNNQKRYDYTRYIINSSFGYSWQPRPKYYNNFKLLEISSVKIYPSSSFQQIIDNYTDPRIKYSYQDHLVLASNYSFTYNEHRFKGLKPFSFFFGAIEIGGIPWDRIVGLGNTKKDSLGQVIVFDVPSAEYVKLETDARYYVPNAKNIMSVFRASIGIGLPYLSSKALPFEKSFYIGGANSLRGWTIGTLGPGSYKSNAATFEMTGDIKIELNYELRFLLSGSLEGALFTDAGNIWLLNSSDAQPGGEFKFGDFISQMAVDFGYGLRYDLEFLIIRFDIAHPIYQPYNPSTSRWTSTNSSGKLLTGFNFAIGYPF